MNEAAAPGHVRSARHDGKAFVAGARITVERILEKLAAGETVDQILVAHPRLTEEGIRAALALPRRSEPTATMSEAAV
jgi:uncharacterized protein (DUF433 family)